MPKSLFVVLDNESPLMSASTSESGNELNNITIDNNGDGGDGQLTNRSNSLWDSWND